MIVYRLFYRFLFKATKLVNFVIHKELKRQIARTGKIKFHSGGCGCQSGNYKMQNFEKGKSITTNADRTLKRSMRRNLYRCKLRRDVLIELLKKVGVIPEKQWK